MRVPSTSPVKDSLVGARAAFHSRDMSLPQLSTNWSRFTVALLSAKTMVSTVYCWNTVVPLPALPAASRTLARFRVSRLLVVRARLAVGVKVADQVLPSVPTGTRSPSGPLAWDRSRASFLKPVTRSLKGKGMAERAVGLGQVDGLFRKAGDALVEGEGDGGAFASGEAGVADRHRDLGALGVDAEVAAADAARSGVALRVQDAGEVHADGVVGALGVGPGRVAGCPDLAVGADRRQRAQRAFAGVVLDVLGAKAGDALSEGEGDGGGFSSAQVAVADRHRDLGRLGVDAEVAAAGAARSGVALRVQHAGEGQADGVGGALGVGLGRVGGCPDLAVGAHRRQRAQRAFAGVVLDVLGAKAGDALPEGEGDGGGFSSAQVAVPDRHRDLGRLGVDAEVAAAGAARSGIGRSVL